MNNSTPSDPLQQIMQKYNYTPPAQPGQATDWYSQVQDKLKQDNPAQETPAKTGNTGFLKSLISAPATMVARPFQAASDLGDYIGTKMAIHDNPESESAIIAADNKGQEAKQTTDSGPGGIIAPQPASFGDVKKDVGRGVETVALGVGNPIAAGAAFGAGNSLEQGNDLFSVPTLFQTVLGAGAGKVLDLIGQPILNAAGKAIGRITPAFLSDIASQGAKAVEDFAAAHDILPKAASDAINGADKAVSGAINGADKAVSGAIDKIRSKADDFLSPKDKAGVLATPESEVYKLSPAERKAYWDHQTETSLAPHKAELEKATQAHEQAMSDIKKRAQESQAKVDTELQKKSEASLKETQNLKKELDQTSVEEAGTLKPKAVKVYQKNSAHFRDLFDEEFTPEKQSVPLKQSDLIEKLNNEFADNPEMNPVQRLGLDEKGKDITAKEFYDRVKGLKVSSTGSKGTSTFTAGDLAINRTRGILADTLKENGVDLSKANDFWKEWKPLQREITLKVKPFEPGYKTGTMAKVLKDSASEVGDAKNAKFIADFEEQLGEKIGTKTRAVMEKLSATEKQALADKIAAEEAKAKIASDKESAIESQKTKTADIKKDIESKKAATEKDIYDRKFASEQSADIRARNKKILYTALGALGIGTGAIRTFGH